MPEKELQLFSCEYVIDTLQKIRSSTDLSYESDYKELSILKSIADKMGIAIVMVHHTRKNFDPDPFNMISGTTGISGCCDGSRIITLEYDRAGDGNLALGCRKNLASARRRTQDLLSDSWSRRSSCCRTISKI